MWPSTFLWSAIAAMDSLCSFTPWWEISRYINNNAGLGIHLFAYFAQIKWGTVSDSLRSLKTNEWPWENRSSHSEEMSNREQITQVAQKKWGTVSNLLMLLRGNERMSDLLKKIWLKKSEIFFLYVLHTIFVLKKWANRSFPLFGEGCEWIAQVAHQNEWCEWIAQVTDQKWATMSHSLRSLRGNEPSWANRSCLLTKNEQMSELLNFFSKSLICSFLGKKRAIFSENRWAKSQLRNNVTTYIFVICNGSYGLFVLLYTLMRNE